MDKKLKTLAVIDLVEHILKENQGPMSIYDIIERVKEIKEFANDDNDRKTQLYMDITQSAKFVYMGDDQWDLKEHNLEMWDKDGYAFMTHDSFDDEEDEEEDLDFTDFDIDSLEDLDEEEVDDDDDDEEKEEEDEEIKEEKEYIDVELPTKSTDDDDEDEAEIEFDDDDEDDYNEIMDDYEDMYDDD
ncbi:MAG: DNA-directed RNA polymerase subunit delta [Acholeplasmataceae bacterium]|nr:DNA-directed RNA polymerase subunit delta [Acholeplasmataceae bacterium]